MDFNPKYVTADDYFKLFGVELSYELPDNDNTGQKVNSFIFRIEMIVESFLEAELYKKIDFNEMTAYQQEHFKLGILEQINYVIRNSDVSADSGYDPQQGVIVNRDYLKGITIGQNAVRHFVLAGLWSRKIQHGFAWFDDFYGH
jgi:hypothetical protein